MSSKINLLFFTLILFLSLFDSFKQSYVGYAITKFKVIGRTIKSPFLKKIGITIKKPVIQTLGNTLTNSMKMFRQNKNTIKNFICSLKENQFKKRHNFRSKSIRYSKKKEIKGFNYLAHYPASKGKKLFRTEGKTNIQIREASKMNMKEFKSLVNRSTEQIKGKDIGSLINIVSKSKHQLPLLFVTGSLNKLTQFNLLSSDDDNDLHQKDPMDKEKKLLSSEITAKYQRLYRKRINTQAEESEYYRNYKEKRAEKKAIYNSENKLTIAKRSKIYNEQNKDKIAAIQKRYFLKNREKILALRKGYYYNNKERILKVQKRYQLENKDKIAAIQKKYNIDNKEKILEKNRDYKLKNKDSILDYRKKYYQNNKKRILDTYKKYYQENRDKILERRKKRQNDKKKLKKELEDGLKSDSEKSIKIDD